MLRIFVTGDNHIGLKYSRHEQASTLSAKRIDAFDAMVESANRENCSIFAITGDLFENRSISKKDIKTLMEKLSEFRGTVVVLPGNHDYYDKEAQVWKYFEDTMKDYDNIKLLKEYRTYTINESDKEVIFYPALCTSLHSASGENNLGWIKDLQISSDDDSYHIGIAHGAVEGETIDKEGQYFLMSREELESIPVDVWLIGHTHVPFPRELTENFSSSGKIFNAGTHVQTDVACNTEGQCFIIEIDDKKNVRAKKFISGNVCFCRKDISVSANEMENIIVRSLADISDESVVDINLSGAVSDDEYAERRNIIENALSRFMEHEYNDSALSRIISKELVDSEFAETSFSANLLTALLDEPKEAQIAYELLKSLKEER